MKILFCNEAHPAIFQHLASLLPNHQLLCCAPNDVDNHIDGIDVVVPTAIARINAETIAKGTFGFIQQLGVGLDAIDIEAATRAGVWVAPVPGAKSGNAESVAELAVMFMLTLSRRLNEARKNIDNGVFFKPTGICLLEKTVCIVGLGSIGKELAVRLRPFGVKMIALREHPEHAAPAETGIEKVYGMNEMENVLGQADYVVLAVPESPSTHHMMNERTIGAMKPGSFLINVARGGVVNADALLRALQSGHLAGAGLDVFWEEPADSNHPIFKQNVVATPHIGGNTDASVNGITRIVAENIELYAAGKHPQYTVNNPESIRSMARIDR